MENISLTLPSGITAKIKPYITAGERNTISVMTAGATKLEYDINDQGEPVARAKEISFEQIQKADYMLLEFAIKEYDNSTENILQRIKDGRPEDYDTLLKEAKKLIPEKNAAAK